MAKKILTAFITILGLSALIYAYANSDIFMTLNAQSAPSFALPKGAKVVLGKYNNKEIVWDIGNATNNYVLMTSKLLVNGISIYDASVASSCSDNIPVNSNSASYKYCPPTLLNQELAKITLTNTENSISIDPPHVPELSKIKNGGTYGLTGADRAYQSGSVSNPFYNVYWIDGRVAADGQFQAPAVGQNIVQLNLWWVGKDVNGSNIYKDKVDGSVISLNDELLLPCDPERSFGDGSVQSDLAGLRPYALLDRNKIIFAANTLYTDGSWHSYQIDSDGLNDYTEDNPVKLRVASFLTASLNDIKVNNKSTKSTTINHTVQLSVDANVGTNTRISAILYDANTNELKYYKMLTKTQNGTNNYALDLTGIPLGQYQVAVINEEYDPTSQLPVESSPISDVLALEIVDPHKITYTKAPQSGATSGKEYEAGKNVNAGQTVGSITVNPKGAMPLTYSVITNGDNTYQNFEVDGLDGSNSSSNTSLDVKIKSSGPNIVNGGLKAGTYKFCINAVDVNGEPTTPTTNSKVCTSFTVQKSDLTVAFDDPNQTKKSISELTGGFSETATANPTIGTKVTYSKAGGDIGLINIDANTGAITYSGSGSYGKVKIRATADDDPSTGSDNFNSAYTEKELVIYSQVDGSIIPHANSSDVNTPTFTANDSNVKIGGTIGTIKGAPGTPDNVTGGSITYTYGIKSDDDGSFFTVNTNSGVITTNANLAVGSYHITVTVSDKWSSKDIPVMINVGVSAAEDLKFYEDSTSNVAITSKTVTATDNNVSVYAAVKGSSNNNPVVYSLKAGEPNNIIDVNSTSGAITIKSAGTVTIVATKQGASGQADAETELTFTVKAGEQGFIYTDSGGNELPKSGNYYSAYQETYEPNKTFQLYTSGYPTGSVVTYRLKAGSPTDVISVDPNGSVTILNASMNTQKGKVIVQATSHDPSGNYNDSTIELPIDIERGTRTIAFAENPVTVINGTGSVTPNILVDSTIDSSGTAMIEVDASEDNSIAWTSDGLTVQYNWNDASGKDIALHVTKPADRNYKEAKADGTLHILGADESSLTLSTPGKIIYGDHFTIQSTQDDSSSTNVQYTFSADNGVFISAPQVNGNKAEFDALGNSGNTMINIKVTRTADGELPLSKTIQIKVLPKPITIQIDDKEKKRLEENPPLTIKDITNELVSWGGVKDAVDTSVVQLSTTAKKYSPIGTYPITSKNYTTLNDNYPNYTFTLKEGKLNVLDNGNKDFWDVDDDDCPDLNIKINDDQGNPITINGDLNEDGIPDYNIDSNGDGKPDLNIDTDKDDKPDINLVMLKEWKPAQCVEINGIQYASGIVAKAEMNIDLDGDQMPDLNIDTEGKGKPTMNIDTDGDNKPDLNTGVIKEWHPDTNVHAKFDYDTDTQLKGLCNIDTDGDNRPDLNIDLDGDNLPDLNVNTDGKLDKPQINIDSDGDGKPDINVDIDGDGSADENIREITEWKPEHNVDQPFKYDTMKFDETNDPDQSDAQKPDDSSPADSDVKGYYYPKENTGGARSMGGALTGDNTNMMMFMGIGCLSLGLMLWVASKEKQNRE